jgi:glucose/arabinose dehydrogenase
MDDSNNGLIGLVVGLGIILILILGVVAFVLLLVISQVSTAAITPAAPTQLPVTLTPVVTTHTTLPDAKGYKWEKVVDGLNSPLLVVSAGDGSGRLFAVEQDGYIFVVKNGQLNQQPFLNISELLPSAVFKGGYTEQGLLGLAFHPAFKKNGYFFVSYTDHAGTSTIARYSVKKDNPDEADAHSAQLVLTVRQPFPDHNGGNIVFGLDGNLYFGLGDGGSLEDPNRNGQRKSALFSKILRINVDSLPYTIPSNNPFVGNAEYPPETWVMGLRNPWRFSFDRATGDLYIGDVGQARREEVDFQPASSKGGENFGWSAFEGTLSLYSDQDIVGKPVAPIYEYDHSNGCSVTGGYVYRGSSLPALQGIYIFGDYCTGRAFATYRDVNQQWHSALWMQTDHVISSFGQDEQGELYLVDFKGAIYRLTTAG